MGGRGRPRGSGGRWHRDHEAALTAYHAEFRKRLQWRIAEAGFESANAFIASVGLSNTAMHNITANLGWPSIQTLWVMARGLGCEPGDLLPPRTGDA